MGPSATTGKNVRPTTITMMPTSNTANNGVPVGNVPADAGTGCLRPSDPAMASTGIIRKYRPMSMHSPNVVLNHCVLPESPPNADPLLFAELVKAYVISVRPCGPWLKSDP